jgi:hypothetical protein
MTDLGFLPWLVGAIVVGGAISSALARNNVIAPGRQLHQKFVLLGTIAGKTKDEIVGVVSSPTSISGLPNGKILLQWQATGCHMALRFDGDICDGITHQYLNKQ